MKSNSLLNSLVLMSTLTPAYWVWNTEHVRNDPVISMQKIETNGPAITWVQVVIQWKIFLLLLHPSDAHLFPNSLGQNIWNIQEKVKMILQKMILSGKIAVWTPVQIKSYWTTTAVDIWEWKVWFLTASHVLQTPKTPNDVCITNRVIGEYKPDIGLPILQTPSHTLNGSMSYTQFPIYNEGKFLMVQIPSILRYRNMWQWIEWKFDAFVWWSSWAPVVTENPNKKWQYGIVSLFPGWVGDNDGTMNIAQMPRNEVLQEVRKWALAADKKWWDYAVCR